MVGSRVESAFLTALTALCLLATPLSSASIPDANACSGAPGTDAETVLFIDNFSEATLNPARWSYSFDAGVSAEGANEPSAPYSAYLYGAYGEVASAPVPLAGYANVTISFAYEAGGYEEAPDAMEHLHLEAYTAATGWVSIWSAEGDSTYWSSYLTATITLPTQYLAPDFRFSFTCDGTSGNYDYWFVDDVVLQGVSITPGAPSEPLNLAATPDYLQISLSWNPPADDGNSTVIGYAVYRSESTSYLFVNVANTTATSFVDTNVTLNTEYFYYVRAYNSNGTGPISNIVACYPGDGLPSAPISVIATAGFEQVVVDWNPPLDAGFSAITGYTVYWDSTYAGTYPNSMTVTGTVATVTNLLGGTTWYFFVTAENTQGEGDPSAIVWAVPEDGRPSFPESVTVDPDIGVLTVRWATPSDIGGAPVTTYHIYRATGTWGTYWEVHTTPGLFFVDYNVSSANHYYYRVYAENDYGVGSVYGAASGSPYDFYIHGEQANLFSPSKVQLTFTLRNEVDDRVEIDAGELEDGLVIYEDGWEIDPSKTDVVIGTEESIRFDVVLVLDFSANTDDTAGATDDMVSAANGFIDDLGATHRAAVVEFHERDLDPAMLCDFTSDKTALKASIASFAASGYEPGESRSYDAVEKAMDLLDLASETGAVKGVVAISNGLDPSSISSSAALAGHASGSGIHLYNIGFGSMTTDSANMLATLSYNSGGWYYRAYFPGDFAGAFENVTLDLQSFYKLSFWSLRLGGYHSFSFRMHINDESDQTPTYYLSLTGVSGEESNGTIVIPQTLISAGKADAYVRTEHVPDGVDEFRFTLQTDESYTVSIVPSEAGGLIEGWTLANLGGGAWRAHSATPLAPGLFGYLLKIQFTGLTDDYYRIPISFDNTVYAAPTRFSATPFVTMATVLSAPDGDGDGYVDPLDTFPDDGDEWTDTDGDDVGDNGDAYPTNPLETADTDGDGVGDNADPFPDDETEWVDTDGDGVGDNSDEYPTDETEWVDTDGDSYGDNTDEYPADETEWVDTDGDGVGDNSDEYPADETEWVDTDGDGVGDNTDEYPTDETEWVDTDGDSHGDNTDEFPSDATEWADTDKDGHGDNTDEFPDNVYEWVDTDGDGYGDNEDAYPHDALLHKPGLLGLSWLWVVLGTALLLAIIALMVVITGIASLVRGNGKQTKQRKLKQSVPASAAATSAAKTEAKTELPPAPDDAPVDNTKE